MSEDMTDKDKIKYLMDITTVMATTINENNSLIAENIEFIKLNRDLITDLQEQINKDKGVWPV